MSENTASKIIKQVLKAIRHMNTLNLCHRDIKLENIMIDPETMQIKIVDFGFSKFYSKKEQLHTRVGTPYYISPEVLKGSYGKECDMWSIGILTFILLTGFPPFQTNKATEIYKVILTDGIQYDLKFWSTKSEWSLNFIQQ